MNAPGWPGVAPTWASSAKDLVSTALDASRVWFTLGYGILNEVFWPSCSEPQIRDLGFIVAGEGFWTEVKREHRYRLSTTAADIPLASVVHEHDRYRLHLEFIADPLRDVVLIRYRLEGEGLKLYALLAPHLGGSGHGNSARVEPHELTAFKAASALSLAAQGGFARGSAGYVGASDGWQDFHQHNAMTWEYTEAVDGNVALLGELDQTEGILALAFAATVEGARTLAHSSLAQGFDSARDRFVASWRRWARELKCKAPTPALTRAARNSAMVLKVHDDRTYPGAIVASLSVPWGATRDDPGGYHLVWPRDAVEAGLAFLACGHHHEARAMLAYLIATQQPDGHWPQNFFCDGRPFWSGIQLDEAALPVLLAAKLDELGTLGDLRHDATRMVRAALAFVARTGPFSPQDRWEENAGANPFTLAVIIAALVAGAGHGFLEDADRNYALSLADDWNARIESWVYIRDTELDREHGIRGHYVRIAPPGQSVQRGRVVLSNRDGETLPVRNLLGLEFLYLVRLGLRTADDLRVRDTVKLVDALLRVETPSGPFYHRYNEDGYGEHADGLAFDGNGIGRAWPLLTGERGHYALAAGEDPLPYLEAMRAAASVGGMIPEQVWDTEPIPERFLFPGRPTGSAMPLVWAHAEFLKLVTAVQDGSPVERLAAVSRRYRRRRAQTIVHWRSQVPFPELPHDAHLMVEAEEPFVLRFGMDGWKRVTELASSPLGFQLHGVQLAVAETAARQSLEFTRRFLGARGWEGRDWQLKFVTALSEKVTAS